MQFLSTSNLLAKALIILSLILAYGEVSAGPDMELLKLSEDLLYAVKTGEATGPFEERLKAYDAVQLANGLSDDHARITFWVNMYNAWYQILAVRDGLKPQRIFREGRIQFSGFVLSLDDVEHGILRRYRSFYELGFTPSRVPADVIRNLAVSQPDFRIHFALNCGARSCPPIAFYSYAKIDQQLDQAATSFLSTETIVHKDSKTVEVTRLMQWFSTDFGGKPEQLKILSRYLEQELKGYQIKYRDYDWTESLGNFRKD